MCAFNIVQLSPLAKEVKYQKKNNLLLTKYFINKINKVILLPIQKNKFRVIQKRGKYLINFKEFRPGVFKGKGDKFLPQIAQELAELLMETEELLVDCTVTLDDEGWEFIAGILVEFAEDMHNEIGIWDTYEIYNLELFGTPMPLTFDPEEELEHGTIDVQRISHIIWVIYQEMYPEMVLSPYNYDIGELAETAAIFLNEKFKDVPRSSGVKQFLIQPNEYGWDVKRKLIWLGTQSYMFRLLFSGFLEDMEDEDEYEDESESLETMIDITDTFICRVATSWSGLGVIDILAGVLDITPEQKKELRGWYEPHYAYYKILSAKGDFLNLVNLLNDQPYTVRMDNKDRQMFPPGKTVSGSLVKWNNEWYWSGRQKVYRPFSGDDIELLKKEFDINPSDALYIYDKEKLKIAIENNRKLYEIFLNLYGDNLKVFTDGKELIENMKKIFVEYGRSIINEKSNGDILTDEELEKKCHEIPFPIEILKIKQSIGVYFNPEEGYELYENFKYLINGFKKKGIKLTQKENDVIYSFIISSAVSPGFVNRIVKEYGYESILSTFLIPVSDDKSSLDCLLRRYKGQYYRNRYPTWSIV